MASALTALSSMCSALAHSFWWYLAFRILTGATVAGVIAATFLLSVEPVGPNYRGTAILFTGVSLQICTTSLHTVEHSMHLTETVSEHCKCSGAVKDIGIRLDPSIMVHATSAY